MPAILITGLTGFVNLSLSSILIIDITRATCKDITRSPYTSPTVSYKPTTRSEIPSDPPNRVTESSR